MKKNIVIFLIGAICYPIIEILWRGYTHFSMAIVGGICLVLINIFCQGFFRNYHLLFKCVLGAFVITSLEFCTGLIVNVALELNVWDYSYMPLNIMGQVSLPFSMLWFLLCIPAIFICERVEEKL